MNIALTVIVIGLMMSSFGLLYLADKEKNTSLKSNLNIAGHISFWSALVVLGIIVIWLQAVFVWLALGSLTGMCLVFYKGLKAPDKNSKQKL